MDKEYRIDPDDWYDNYNYLRGRHQFIKEF